MIPGFEDITYDLTAEEEKLIPVFVKGLSKKIGKDNAVTSTHIMRKIPGLNGARVRKIINYIRNNYLVPGLLANSSGYYVSKSKEEVREYINSLGHREAAIYSVRKKMEEYLKTL